MPVTGRSSVAIDLTEKERAGLATILAAMISDDEGLRTYGLTSQERSAIYRGFLKLCDAAPRVCGAMFIDAADEPVSCSLARGHDGRHYDRGFTWVPDLRERNGP